MKFFLKLNFEETFSVAHPSCLSNFSLMGREILELVKNTFSRKSTTKLQRSKIIINYYHYYFQSLEGRRSFNCDPIIRFPVGYEDVIPGTKQISVPVVNFLLFVSPFLPKKIFFLKISNIYFFRQLLDLDNAISPSK